MSSKLPSKCNNIVEPIFSSGKSSSNEEVIVDNANCGAKKSRDITSLRSNDSGIICGSESDQSSNRISHSRESLDSGEVDNDEECIEILETISMDEDYKMLQSDLRFYQQSNQEMDCGTLKSNKKSTAAIAKQDDDEFIEQNIENVDEDCNVNINESLNSQNQQQEDQKLDITKNIQSNGPITEPSKQENIKNEVLFKNFNFFGVTKSAIFRTAQSIIENHEKKVAARKGDINPSVNSTTEPSLEIKSPVEVTKKKEFFTLKSNNKKLSITSPNPSTSTTLNSPVLETPQPQLSTSTSFQIPSMFNLSSPTSETNKDILNVQPDKQFMIKSASSNSLNKIKVPGVVKCFIRENKDSNEVANSKTDKGPSGLLRFLESPIFNIHFAIHYLFYSKEPGVLSFIGNKIFNFNDKEVDLYIPQLIVMYIQMDELAEVLDPYLTMRCRSSVDFSLKCLWLFESYNYQVDSVNSLPKDKRTHLQLIRELYSKKERKQLKLANAEMLSPIKKTHHRSQSDATYLLNDTRKTPGAHHSLNLSSRLPIYQIPLAAPMKLCLGDLTSGRAFDNGCTCFESVKGAVNDLLGHKIVCCCGAPKTAPQKEFMKALINIGKNLTSLQTKAEKNSALRIFLNLINKNLPARVWLPLHSDNIPHHIVRISEEKTVVLNSKDKCPYIIYVEVVEVNDIYSSPVIMKMMPTLRHTKSEENLESKDTITCSHAVAIDPQQSMNLKNLSTISKMNSESCENCQILHFSQLNLSNEDDVWSQDDDDITAQYYTFKNKINERDAISQKSLDSDIGAPVLFNIGDVRNRHCRNLNCENVKPFSNDPEDPSAAALKEPWHEKEQQIREASPYGHLTNWKLLAAIVKCGDDLRQELMATQLLEMFKLIWDEEKVNIWVKPYKIVCLSDDSGLIEPILNTVSLHQIKKNSNKSLRDYFIQEYGDVTGSQYKIAQKNFVQSCAGYSLISYLLQVKDRHNGNILLHSDGHLIHIDFGFILSISPKNLGFEQSPFKLTDEFVEVMDGLDSELWNEFNLLLLKGLMAARKHMDRIINLVEIMRSNAQLPCFKNGCSGTVQNLRKRFHMNLTHQELERKVEQLVQDSLKSLSTKLYDNYQYFTNGIL